MQTRSTWSIDAGRRAPIAALLLSLAVFGGCEDEPAPVAATECRPNQFRLCDHECGRGVEQCVEPGVWKACACAVLDASRPEARSDRDASDGGTTDASPETGDAEARDAEAGDGSAREGGGDDSQAADAPPATD